MKKVELRSQLTPRKLITECVITVKVWEKIFNGIFIKIYENQEICRFTIVEELHNLRKMGI